MGVLVRVGALVQLEHTMAVRAAGSSTKNLTDHFREVVFLLSMEILLFKDAMALLNFGYSVSNIYIDENKEALPAQKVKGGVEEIGRAHV